MCIVADRVKDVSKTKIASFHVGYSFDEGKNIIPAQLIVYSANVNSGANTNAFILPIYNPGNDNRKIIPLDFSHLSKFFYDTERIFNRWFPDTSLGLGSYSAMNSSNGTDSYLPVHKVGDYKFSIMPSKIYFNQLDRNQLNVTPMAKTSIDMHSNDYSFIIYQFFQKGNIEITPFAYLCAPYKENEMIIPTVHGHPHDNIPTGSGYESDFENEADFDHELYIILKNRMDKIVNSKDDVIDIDKLFKQIKTDYTNSKIKIYCPRSFIPKKIKITGYKQNRNLLVSPDKYFFIKDLYIDSSQHGYR